MREIGRRPDLLLRGLEHEVQQKALPETETYPPDGRGLHNNHPLIHAHVTNALFPGARKDTQLFVKIEAFRANL